MALSVLDVYKRVLPKTNCGECGRPSCLAFASMVVSEGESLSRCPYLDPETLVWAREEIERQRAEGKWTRKDLAAEALSWARERAASVRTADLPARIGGSLMKGEAGLRVELPYFQETLRISEGRVEKMSGEPLTRWEQVFLYNHLAQGGSRKPTGEWKGLVELPNTISKIKSMQRHVEEPLIECFRGRGRRLVEAGLQLGGEEADGQASGADAALLLRPLPRVPVLLLFWDEDPDEGYDARVKLLFDESVVDHLDIESIMFLSERIRQLLCGGPPEQPLPDRGFVAD